MRAGPEKIKSGPETSTQRPGRSYKRESRAVLDEVSDRVGCHHAGLGITRPIFSR